MQTKIDFSHPHNNRESEVFFDENISKFGDQCQKVYKLLKSGVRLSVKTAMNLHDISSLPRRIKDLKDNGVDVKDEWVRDESGKRLYKEYFFGALSIGDKCPLPKDFFEMKNLDIQKTALSKLQEPIKYCDHKKPWGVSGRCIICGLPILLTRNN